MQDQRYIQIQGWMINKMDLKDAELLIYAVIYGFSQDGISKYEGGNTYLMKTLKYSKGTVKKWLDSLVEKKYIIKETYVINNVTLNKFFANIPLVQKMTHGGSENDPRGGSENDLRGGSENDPNNTILRNTSISNTKENTEKLFSEDVNKCFIKCLCFFPEYLHPKNPKKWLETIEKLNRIDKIPFEKIIEIVQKTRNNDFWSKNFLSLVKLRQKNRQGVMWVVYFNEQIKTNIPKSNKEAFNNAMQSDAAKEFRY